MGIGRDDLLPEGLRAPADEEETARDAVDRLAQGVDAADAAGGYIRKQCVRAAFYPLDGAIGKQMEKLVLHLISLRRGTPSGQGW